MKMFPTTLVLSVCAACVVVGKRGIPAHDSDAGYATENGDKQGRAWSDMFHEYQ